ncbi:MAG: NAD(P)/FAD-dependent oxidoreductase [Thermoprotei archaeon]
MTSKIVIVGAGLGGSVVTNALAKYDLDVTVIDSSSYHLYQPGIVDYVINEVEVEDITRPLEKVVNRKAKLVRDKAVKIDLNGRKVITARSKEIDYDYLVLAPGVINKPSPFPSWHTLDEGKKIREELLKFSGKRIMISYRLPVKCPAAPFEIASHIKAHLQEAEVTLLLPLKEAPPLQRRMSEILGEAAKATGVRVVRGAEIQDIDTNNKVITTAEGKFEYDLALIDSAITVPPEFKDLANEKGFIPVDKETLKMKGHDEVFVVGDANDILTPPKNGAAAHFQGITVAEEILAETVGNMRPEKYKGDAMCAVYVGHDRGGFVYMNFENSYILTPTRTFRIIKRMFTNLYWSTLTGAFDSTFKTVADYFWKKAKESGQIKQL